MLVLGLENWGVLVTLNASNLNSNPMPSRIEKRREAEASKLKEPGPQKAYRSMLPCTPMAVGWTNADVSNQKSLSIPPSTWKGATWIGVWVVPLAASELPLAVKCNGVPLIRVMMPLMPQLPKIQLPAPDRSQCLPWPNDSAYTKICTNVCFPLRLRTACL